jgi:excinuclease ABC subunit C
LIDGGKGQVEAARSVLRDLGVADVPVVGIAKGQDRDAGRETFFVEGRDPFRLPPRDPALYFVQRLRDEAHRFAITGHRRRRAQRFNESILETVPGLGPAKRKALLQHFGGLQGVLKAARSDLERAPGIGPALAQNLYDALHPGE